MAKRIERGPSATAVCLLLAAGLLATVAVHGQEPVVPLRLSFSDPGARSMGFGGAFVALADDATAALANPAGLVQLARPEVSIEGRLWSYSTPYTQRGRVEGLPSGVGVDTLAGLRSARSEDDLAGLSFLSVVYPKGRWAVAFFRHQLANFEFSSETRGLFAGGSQCCQLRFFDQRSSARLDIVSHGISAAYRVSDRLALGLGAAHHDVRIYSETTMFVPADGPAGLLGPTSFLPQYAVATEANFSDDRDWTLAAGLLWKLARGWTVGGVYREGPRGDFGVEITAGAASGLGVAPGSVLFRFTGLAGELPDVLGLGVAYRAEDDRVTVSFQWDRIEYADLTRSLPIDDKTIDDVEELHLGGEYVFLDATPIVALRLGMWLDPDHQLRATTDDPFLRALLPPGDDELHLTAGLGLAFQGFQVDLGVDLSDPLDSVSLSAIYSF